jgi:hypothetical protein
VVLRRTSGAQWIANPLIDRRERDHDDDGRELEGGQAGGTSSCAGILYLASARRGACGATTAFAPSEQARDTERGQQPPMIGDPRIRAVEERPQHATSVSASDARNPPGFVDGRRRQSMPRSQTAVFRVTCVEWR